MPHSQFAAKTDLPLSEDEQYLNRRVSQFVICECESSQMEEGIGFAEVIDSEQLPKLINEVDVFKVRAKMCGPEHDYSNDTFFVKILNSAPEFIEMKSRRMVHHGPLGKRVREKTGKVRRCPLRVTG